MVIERDLKVTPEEFYEYMIDTVVEQIENTFGKSIDRSRIKSGYSHKTQMTNRKTGSKRTTKYSITKAEPNKEFATVFSSADYRTKVSYKMSEAPQGMHIIYEQKTTWTHPEQEPSGLGGKIDQFILRRKLTRSLKQVEKAIRKNR